MPLHLRILICVQSLFFVSEGAGPYAMSWHSFVESWRKIRLLSLRSPTLGLPWRSRQHFPCFTTGGLTPLCLGIKPLETHDQIFSFSSEPLRS
jgi:hypothetical protein